MDACTFPRAITRRPAPSVVDGLRAVDTGTPDLATMLTHHSDYIAALRETGAEVIELPPLDAFPDALFVEDTALCLPEGAVLMRPGAPSRQGEVDHMAAVLADIYQDVQRIDPPGHIEGGDILWTGREVLVGLSARTDAAGVAQLAAILDRWGHTLRVVETPPGVLHFKTDCALLCPDTILATERLSASGCFDDYRVLHVPEGEEPAANAIRFNDLVLMAEGFPRTATMLDRADYALRIIGNSECAKLDGGMSCLSMRLPV
jgi:dimethylargininase